MGIPNAQQLNIEIVAQGIAGVQGDNAKNISNTFHYRRAVTINNIDLAAVESQFQTHVMVPLTNMLNVRYTQVQNTVRMMNDPTSAALAVSRALPGAITGDSMPSHCMGYVLLGTGQRGKSYRGNKKIGPMSESDTTIATADIFNAACLARFATFITAITNTMTDGTPNTWIPVIYSRLRNPGHLLPVIATSDITVGRINKRVSSMRRRKVLSEY